MRYQRGFFRNRGFFEPRRILSANQALFFVIEEAAMVFLIALQLYRILGIEIAGSQVLLFAKPLFVQNVIWFAASIIFFLIGYVVIALRDESVWLVHKNFSRMVFGTTRLKLQFATKRKAALLFFELAYTLIVAVSIFIYLDPDINVVPYPYNYIGFAFLFVIGLVLFSHSKDYRGRVYGATPMQKRLNFGRHSLARITNKKTGSIRIAPKNNYKKSRKWAK